ncbi:Oxidoreductase molybdopterin binding domain protein [Roseovarius gaetbuli]|uniref:Oxidoreductase molybdopterin binding domain protein n=2 Tax=Roseovarius gaetbuli TaxID=1356575 RepID=A0A1X6Y2Y1_9RHOB|nr:Oxidoreductase molybdopterin binding domain protein [Roseovarius gaetbuli]
MDLKSIAVKMAYLRSEGCYMRKRWFMSGLIGCFLTVFGATTGVFATEEAPVVLTITLPQAESGDTAVIALSEQDLRAFPAISFETSTIWTSGVQRFTGVPLLALLEHFKIEARELQMQAVNDYSITMPVDGITAGAPIIAYERNGKPMKLRDNGPLWLIYNYDANADYRTETVYSRSIWQLDRMAIIR